MILPRWSGRKNNNPSGKDAVVLVAFPAKERRGAGKAPWPLIKYAIESTGRAKIAKEVFAANGLAEKITRIEGWPTRVNLPEKADVYDKRNSRQPPHCRI